MKEKTFIGYKFTKNNFLFTKALDNVPMVTCRLNPV